MILKILRTKNLTIITFLLVAFLGNNVRADDGVKNRFRSCTPEAGGQMSSDKAHPEGLDFNPTGYGKDFEYELDNPICAAVVLPPYAAVKLAIATMNGVCGSGSPVPRVTPSPLLDTRDLIKASKNANNAACRAAVVGAFASLSGMVASISFQYLNAKDNYEDTWLCGADWTDWNSQSMSKDIPNKKKTAEATIKGWIKNCQDDPTSADCDKLSSGFSDIHYREWYYSGVEKEDTSDSACPDVTRHFGSFGDDSNKIEYNGNIYPAQRYYMRGTEPGNYACDRYNIRFNRNDPLTGHPFSVDRARDYTHAYQCCLQKSKTTVCIERKYCNSVTTCLDSNKETNHKFCEGGERCSIGPDITKTIYNAKYMYDNRMICVSTYNMCPYNFNIGGGSTECDMFKDGVYNNGVFIPTKLEHIAAQNCQGKSEIRDDDCTINAKASKCKNYCQYLNHCVVVGGNDYIYNTNIGSPYFSSACIDFTGDSKNSYGYNTGIFAGNMRHFTAPMAQCVKETLENVFYNKAGHSECGNLGEFPDQNGKCFSDFYRYKKGEYVAGQYSFFSYLQDKIKDIIKMALTVAITIFGVKILLGGQVPKAPEIIIMVVKLSLIMYFVLGSAWQDIFFNGVYNVSSTFSEIVMNIKTSPNALQRDGCQFGKITLPDGSKQVVSTYPAGKEYLAVWDTLDCKVAKYLGFGPSFSVANIAKLILSGFLTGTLGVYFALLTLIFGIYLIVAALTALHIFLVSAFTIILLVYVSPITITLSLFKRTENMFKGWLNNLIGASLQPVLLFAYIGLFFTVFDTVMIGSATFSGNPPEKSIVCDKICVDRNGNQTVMNGSDASDCDIEAGDKILDPMSDSVACMINLSNDKFGKIPILEPLGIALPLLKDFFTENGREKILTMTKAALVLYILVGFMAQIPAISQTIMGGESMPTGSPLPIKLDPRNMARKLGGAMAAMQERGMGLARKAGGAAKSAAGNAKEVARAAGSKKSDNKGSGSGSGSGNSVGKTDNTTSPDNDPGDSVGN